MSIVVEGAGDEQIEILITGFSGSEDQIGA